MKKQDLFVAVYILAAFIMFIVPIPSWLLDILLAFNISIAFVIMFGCMFSKEPLDIDELLDTLGLAEHKDKFPNQLSGGQQQRCAIGRALVKNPQILLCDEPTGALDYSTSKDILELIEKINRKYHNTIIIVTHNQAIGLMADRILKLRDGKITSDTLNENKTAARNLEW